jgi:hypothetical protein
MNTDLVTDSDAERKCDQSAGGGRDSEWCITA